jgi:hypothetical protein
VKGIFHDVIWVREKDSNLPNNTITPGPNKSKDVFHTQNSLVFSANLHSNVYEMMSFKVRKTETF